MIVAITLLLILDLIWIKTNKNMYNTLVKQVTGKPLRLNPIGALIAYPLMIIALVFIVLRNAKLDNGTPLYLAIKHGGLLGLVVYGVFNATNVAMFQGYDIKVAVMDTLWGTFVYTLVTYVALRLTIVS